MLIKFKEESSFNISRDIARISHREEGPSERIHMKGTKSTKQAQKGSAIRTEASRAYYTKGPVAPNSCC